jgi:KTSC domain
VALRTNIPLMPAVTSTAILRIEYDEFLHQLQITFAGSNTYVYYDVPRGVYAGFLQAASKGTYFNACIRDHYRFTQLPRISR